MTRSAPRTLTLEHSADRAPRHSVKRLVRPLSHLLHLMSGRNDASTPIITPTKMNAPKVNNQLLSRHQGRNDQVRETSVTAGQVDAQTHSPRTSSAPARPEIKPTVNPFLRFGHIRALATPNVTLSDAPPQTHDMKRRRNRRVRSSKS